MSSVCDLSNRHCEPCEGGIAPMDREQAEAYLAELEGWELSADGKMINKRFEFRGFFRTMSFINAMAWVVNQENHHPDFSAGYNFCEVRPVAVQLGISLRSHHGRLRRRQTEPAQRP